MKSLKVGRHHQVVGAFYGTPKEVWGFGNARVRDTPVRHARRFVKDNAGLFGLEGVRGALEHQRTIDTPAATHVLLRQKHRGRKIHRAYLTVHIGADGRVYLAKNRAVPARYLPPEQEASFTVKPSAARRRARAQLPGTGRRIIGAVEEVWFPVKQKLRPAYKVRVHAARPRRERIIYLDAERNTVLETVDSLAFVRGVGCVFVPNPVVVAEDWRDLKGPRRTIRRPPMSAYRLVTLENLQGKGRALDGRHVSTSITPRRVRRADRQFIFGAREPGFEEVMVYYYVDRVICYLESLGYRGGRRIFRKPVKINARGTRDDNSWYSPGEQSLTFGTGGVDDAEDGEIILHEFGHALQDAICPDFGQSEEAEAMGEGFGDYLAASFFAAAKAVPWRPCVMSWDAVRRFNDGFPALRRVDQRVTYRRFEEGGDCHDNGEIWSATLWDILLALGRDVADRIIIESHFQQDGFTTFTRGARAILDADRNLYGGRHAARLRKIFRDRKVPLREKA